MDIWFESRKSIVICPVVTVLHDNKLVYSNNNVVSYKQDIIVIEKMKYIPPNLMISLLPNILENGNIYDCI